jgi:Secretion system C-terminal sorting domain
MQLKRITVFLLATTIFLQCRHQDKLLTVSSEEEMDGMEQAMRQEFLMTRDPQLNVIPAQRLETARAYMQTLLPGGGSAARIMSLGWQERGPNNIGGRTRSVMIDKRDATGNTVFAGSISGGLFKTTNFTSPSCTWTVVNDFLPNLAITNVVQDNNNLNIMYASTGEGWFNIDAIRGAGIFKSIDGGTTWNQMPSTADFEYMQDFVIDNNGNLYVALRNLISSNRGVMRSTDGGVTWTQVLGAPLPGFNTGRAADLEVASNGDIYASLGLVGAAFTNRSVLMKSSATNGANTGALGTWVDVLPIRGLVTQRVEIAVAPSDPQRVYLLMQDSATDQVIGTYRSFNGGSTWDSVASPAAVNNGANSQAWYDLIAAVDPNNADILVAGGVNMAKSTDAGVTWTTITTSNTVHVDHHFLQYNGSSKLIDGNDGGVYYSENINAASPTFSSKNNGYNVTQFYACAFHPTNANYFLAGAQDNNTQKFTVAGINTTTPVVGGDGGFCHIDQTDGQIQIASTTSNNYFRSTNGGNNFSSLGAGINNNRGQFINPTDFDNNNKILYCGDDPGKYFFITGLATTPSGTVVSIPTMGTREVTAVKIDPSTANTIWVGASFGTPNALSPQVLKISNANTASPTILSSSFISVAAGAAISNIDVDPANANNVLVTLSNYGIVSVWESTNGGTSWTNIEGNLPDMPVHWGIFAPANAQLNGAGGGDGGILLATELGVWTTSQINGASTQWIPNNSGLANVSTYMLRYRPSDNLVVAATHGRGLFTTILPTVVTGVPDNTITKDFIKYISADNSQLQIVIGTLQTKTMTVQLIDMGGRLVDQRKNKYQNSVIDLNRLQSGVYIVKITGDKKENFVQQFVKR